MTHIVIYILTSLILSIFFDSYFPLLFLYSIILAFIIQESETLLAILVITSPMLLLGFNLYNKKIIIRKKQMQTEERQDIVNTEKISEKKQNNKQKIKEADNIDSIIDIISKNIEDKKEIFFSELSTIWQNNAKIESNLNENEIKIRQEESETKQEEPVANVKEENESEVQGNKHDQQEQEDEEDKEDEINYQNVFVVDIYNNFVKDMFYSESYYLIAKKLLEHLDLVAKEPSISTNNNNDENSYQNFFDVLKKITLAEHTYNVVKKAFYINKERYGNTWKVTWDTLCVVSIAHDLGKAGIYNTKTYYGSHKEASCEVLKNVIEETEINLTDEAIKDLLAIISYHHGIPSPNYAENNILKMLRESDSAARQEEIKKSLKSILTWKDIDIKEFGLKLYEKISEKAFISEAANNPFFIVDVHKGLLFIHNLYIFLEVMEEYIKEKNIFWQEFQSIEPQVKAEAIKTFIENKIKPEQWLPSQKISPSQKDYFYFMSVEKNGKVQTKPFVVFILNTFCKTIEIDAEKIVQTYKESPLNMFNVLYRQ